MFQGCWASILRDAFSYPVAFVYFEKLLRVFGDRDQSSTSGWQQFLAGGVSGLMSWIVCFPFDVVKTHIQSRELHTPVKFFNQFQIAKQLAFIIR